MSEHRGGRPATTRRAPWREALEADGRFEPLADEEATHEQTTDRERLLAMIASFSWIGGLPDDRRDGRCSPRAARCSSATASTRSR